MSPLDGRAPFVIDVRDLGRRAGAMLAIARQEPAPGDLSNPMIEVPPGSSVSLQLRLESVIEGVLVTGTVIAMFQGSCGRCLEEVRGDITVTISELFRYSDQVEPGDDEDLPVVEGDLLDLEPTVRDELVLALPLSPLCQDDCLGLCPDCGFELATDPSHKHDRIDSRWEALAQGFGDFPDSTLRPS